MNGLLTPVVPVTSSFTRWIGGTIGAFISGGASSVAVGLTAVGIDPQTFNFASGFSDTLKLMGVSFIVAGMMSLAKFLANHPLPDGWDGEDRRGR